MPILFELQDDQHQPKIPRLDVCSTRYAGIVHDEVHSSHFFQDLDALCLWGHKAKRILSVSCLNSLTSRYQSIVDDRMKITRTSNMVNMMEERIRAELQHCLVMKDQ